MNDSFEDRKSAAEGLIDRAARQIENAEPDAETVQAAADRVWHAMTGEERARPKMRLVSSNDASEGARVERLPAPAAEAQTEGRRWGLWALAALLVLGLGAAQILYQQFATAGPSATVKTVDGQLFRVDRSAHVPLSVGDVIREGDVVRSGRDGGSVITLEDGSLVELSVRSELSIDESRRGTTLDLTRGNVIVEAAEQRARHLYVSTDDCLVSVTGTIFSVNHGTKGSRVSVIEGEVRVDHSGTEDVLLPGDQITTHKLLAPLSVADEIAWSQKVDSYLQILREYVDLQQAIEQRVTPPGLRYSSRLLDLMPADTALFVASPNVAEAVTETHRIFEERLAESPALQQWLDESADGFQSELDEAMKAFGELGSYLGEEIAVGAQTGVQSDDSMGAVVLAEVLDPAGLQDFIERQIAEHGGAVGEGPIFVDNPADAVGEALWIWLQDGLAIGSPSGEKLREIAGYLEGANNPFTDSEFYSSVSALYAEGAEFIVAGDMRALVGDAVDASSYDGERQQQMAALGADNARHLMFEQKRVNEKTQHRMVLTFDEARRGIASWLAPPAPMGGLSFVSPDAKLVTSVVFKDPA
ncbi:MAG: FecR family protein, partial [Acidobacteriota bacterium]